jgi:RNA polymerase-binding transcription factor DksA
MKSLRPVQLAQLDAKLGIRVRELREDIRRELLQSDQERYREVAGMVHDLGDESVANLVADLDAAAIDRDVRELREVEAARARLKGGTYGTCADCGVAIPWPRLLAQPHAVRCVTCAQKREKTHAHEAMPRL